MSDEQRLVLSVLSAIRLADVQRLAAADANGIRRELDALLEKLARKLYDLANGISEKYLVHAGPAHQLSDIGWS
jgi:uncharacterized alpha-E superfamily protein